MFWLNVFHYSPPRNFPPQRERSLLEDYHEGQTRSKGQKILFSGKWDITSIQIFTLNTSEAGFLLFELGCVLDLRRNSVHNKILQRADFVYSACWLTFIGLGSIFWQAIRFITSGTGVRGRERVLLIANQLWDSGPAPVKHFFHFEESFGLWWFGDRIQFSDYKPHDDIRKTPASRCGFLSDLLTTSIGTSTLRVGHTAHDAAWLSGTFAWQ